MHAQNIAGHIFERVEFSSNELSEKSIQLIMKNNDYPIEHFQGFLQEWQNYSGLHGNVRAEKKEDAYVYTIQWE
jgi:hypothetical protein